VEIGSPRWKQIIADGARQLGVTLEDPAVELFAAHARELLKWNRKINLTAITDPLEVAVKHYLDSIAPLRFLPRAVNLLDIGSGGGFPGIPLKIVMPDVPATLIDASRKKVGFLAHAGRLMGLDGFQAVHARAEDLARRVGSREGRQEPGSRTSIDRLPQSFSLVVTRALASIDRFLSLGLPVLSEGGRMVALKGRVSEGDIDFDRVAAAGLAVTVQRYELPYLHAERSLVILESRCGNRVRDVAATP
jgi:16S rRNA (guanine527-N7)-methyltransferase